MDYFLAALLGTAFGGVQLFLLILAARSVAGKIKIWAFVVQFFCPIAGLLLCALLARNRLILCASIICAVLIVGALVKFQAARVGKSGQEKKG